MNNSIRMSIVVACSLTWFSPIAAQQKLPGTAVGDPPPQLENTQQALLNAVSRFFARVRQRQPGNSGVDLSDAVREWSAEIRTITVKTGESENAKKAPDRQVTRIYFGPFIGREDAATKGEYDPEFGTIKLDEQLIHVFTPNRVPTPAYGSGERHASQIMQEIDVAQTVWHEFHHATQGRQPGTIENETITYHATLNATRVWISSLENDYRSARTLENARYLVGAIDAWFNYRTTIENQTALKLILPRDLPLADHSALTSLRADIFREHQTIELLEGLSGPSLIPGTARTLDEMLRNVRAVSVADLERQLYDVARRHADEGTIRNHDAAKKAQESSRRAKDALPLVQKAWEAKLNAVGAIASRLSNMKLMLSTQSSELSLDGATGKATIRVQVDNNRDYAKLVGEIFRAVEMACGSKLQVDVYEQWSVTDLSLPPDEWKGQAARDIEVPQPKEYAIALTRTVKLPDFGTRAIEGTYRTQSNKLSVTGLAPYPRAQELTGTWSGTLTIVESPYLDALANAAPQEETVDSEQCQQLAVNVGPMLRSLKGKPLEMTVRFHPTSETNGHFDLIVKAPSAPDAATQEPQRIPYGYGEGKLTVDTLQQKNLRMRMSASFSAAGPAAWSFDGKWEGMADIDGRIIPVMSGVWKAHKP